MAFRLKSKEPVQAGVRRIVLEQVEKAIANIDNTRLPREEAIHEVRRSCKRIRAVLRLIRPMFEDRYDFENAFFRDAADELAGLRDAQMLLKTYDKLTRTPENEVDRRHFIALRRELVRHNEKVARNIIVQNERLAKVRERLCVSCKRIGGWKLEASGFDAIEAGLLKTYAQGRKAMKLAYEKSGAAGFHEWRKSVNHHRFHMRLLRNLWRPMMKSLRRQVEKLADLLGDDHDLAVLRAVLSDQSRSFANVQEIGALLDAIDKQSAELRAKARLLGERIYAEKPKQLGKRFQIYWEILKSGGKS